MKATILCFYVSLLSKSLNLKTEAVYTSENNTTHIHMVQRSKNRLNLKNKDYIPENG
jgi:hypothetical protein